MIACIVYVCLEAGPVEHNLRDTVFASALPTEWIQEHDDPDGESLKGASSLKVKGHNSLGSLRVSKCKLNPSIEQ